MRNNYRKDIQVFLKVQVSPLWRQHSTQLFSLRMHIFSVPTSLSGDCDELLSHHYDKES